MKVSKKPLIHYPVYNLPGHKGKKKYCWDEINETHHRFLNDLTIIMATNGPMTKKTTSMAKARKPKDTQSAMCAPAQVISFPNLHLRVSI
jgi:hypothetical protein